MLATDTHNIFRFQDSFFDIFHNPNYKQSISFDDASRKDQINYLRGYLDKLGCISVLVENQYVDHDFLDDYASYYAKCFSQYDRFCRRAHFFSSDLAEIDLEAAIIERHRSETDTLRNSYLGFVVIKPLPDAVVGRTVLKSWDEDGGKRRFTATREYKANLFGLELTINSLAFQEQDTVSAACATTALWSAFQMTSQLFGTSAPTPSDVTRAATRYLQTSRPTPSHGLSIEQICYAISENSLAPEVHQINPDTSVNSLIYSYISARVPVVLGYRIHGTDLRHAVTVCGYRLEDSSCHVAETHNSAVDMNLLGRRISEFYVHDDNLGPFSRLKCEGATSSSSSGAVNPRVFKREVDWRSSAYQICCPEVVIVPVYHKVRLSFNDLAGAVRKIDRYFKALNIDVVDKDNPLGVEWEIRLMDLPTFKREMVLDGAAELWVKKRLLFASLPRFVWVSTARLWGKPVFTFVADATDIERSFYFLDFIDHFPLIRENIANIINESDPGLQIAAHSGLQVPFVSFIRESILRTP